MLQLIVGALLPVVTTLLLGALAGWRGDQNPATATSLNAMVLDYALPLILFVGTVATPRSTLVDEFPMAGALLVGLVGPALFGFGAARYLFRRDLSASSLEAMCLGIPAVAFTGLPMLTPIIGARMTTVVAWATVIDNTIVLPAVITLLSIARDEQAGSDVGHVVRDALISTMRKPIVVAPLAAIALVVLGIKLPADFISAFKLLGGTVGGVSLFASGVILQAQTISLSWPALATSIARILLVPGIAFVMLSFLHVDHELLLIVTLTLALPASPLQVMLSVSYKVHEKENAVMLLYSNVLCIPCIASFIWLVGV